VNFLGSNRSGGSGEVCVSDDRCFVVALLLLRVSNFFDGDFLFCIILILIYFLYQKKCMANTLCPV
jgi:hypothetical protein